MTNNIRIVYILLAFSRLSPQEKAEFIQELNDFLRSRDQLNLQENMERKHVHYAATGQHNQPCPLCGK